ncbi:glycoside hydrolase family 16 protein [Mycena vitilis]|nr:glycoside hydrolase family 16 protein [Mycena vitilis]
MKHSLALSVQSLFFSFAVSVALGAKYFRTDSIHIPDPTHGRVNYVSKTTAEKQNLTAVSGDTFILRADHHTVINNSSAVGRNSVRIRTNKAYTTHVAVFDILHMPEGCGWETNEAKWPAGGEVDILEGVNDQGTDQVTLHTSPGFTSLQLDCDVSVNFNTGCGVRAKEAPSYGPSLNAHRGGWYAIERTNKFISVWFWSRNAAHVPVEVKAGHAIINTHNWGIPAAHFPDTSCNLREFFDANNIIINLTLCTVYAASGCPSSCNDFVDNNPAALANAYFQFNSISIYE